MKSLFTKSLVPPALVAISLALSGGTAMAAQAQIHHSPRVAHVVQPHAAARVAARYRQPPFARNDDLGQFIAGFFGGVMPQQYGRYVASPSYDNAPAIDTSSAATDAQAASDQEVQQIQQMNDESALNASMAAAEQQNDAANAATLQTEINAGF